MKKATLFICFASLIVLLGCSGNKGRTDQKLVLAFDNSPRSFDPRFAMDANSQYLTDLLNCSLVKYTADGGYENQLASEIKWINDKSISIKISPSFRFQKLNRQVNSLDVKTTFDFFINHSSKTPKSAAFKNLERIELKGNNELVFHMNKPDAAFVVNSLGVGILPKELANKTQQIKDFNELDGCSAFKITEFSQHKIELVSSNKSLRDMTIKVIKDEGTRFLKLRKGEIDLAQNLSREKVAKISNYPKLDMKKRLGLNTAYLAFNTKDKIVGNPKVRLAIAHAIDKKSLIKYVLKGMAQSADNLLVPNSGFDNPRIKSPGLDLSLAKKILDEQGFIDPDGDGPKMRFQLHYKTTTNRTRVTIAKAIVSQLKKIGIDVRLQTLEWGKFKKDIEEGKAQMWTLKWVGFKDPDILHYAFHSQNHAPVGGNRGFYTNKKLDTILDKARLITDKKQRQALYFKAQEILANELPYINLWHEEVFAVFQKSYKDYVVYADGRFSGIKELKKTEKLKINEDQ